ncbi:MAG TPA: TIGR03617 family F420-dependent LLM class oxidoreductase [Acidimicrobiales bacterium]|nr:TIGR03617 family F420-dependent LLM class oxidoreductase [Acidimicrobiales bacterium]
MNVDGRLDQEPSLTEESARAAEMAGYAGVRTTEAARDPFIPLAVAATVTGRLELSTAIAVAFARSPMNLAGLANDLHQLSEGRFTLGLGSQVAAHITRRYSMPWSRPAARMRELVLAIRAIWHSWATDETLDFEGEFYTHTLMTPFFSPGPNPYGNPKILVAAVGPQMAAVAGEVADGLLAHGFTTERYLREVTLPAMEQGAGRGGRRREDLTVSYGGFLVTGRTDEDVARATRAVKEQIAFYGSTRAYRPVLELHGWGDLQPELAELARRGAWESMADAIDDEVLAAFSLVCPPEEVAPLVLRTFGDIVDRFSFYTPYEVDPALWREVLPQLHRAAARPER